MEKFLHRNGVYASRPMGPIIRVLKFLVWHMGERGIIICGKEPCSSDPSCLHQQKKGLVLQVVC